MRLHAAGRPRLVREGAKLTHGRAAGVPSARALAAAARARELFLDEERGFGCAEATFVALKEAFGLPDAGDSSAALALNGGVAYSGGVCGALSAACLAAGLVAGRELPDHAAAKRAAVAEAVELIADFRAEFGATDCRSLTGRDISTPEGHAAFIDAGLWRRTCTAQLEFVARRLAGLPGRARREADPGAAGNEP